MIVFGGTNGSEKVNDVHILDLRTKEWSRPHCKGNPPSPRESHTASVISDDKLLIFGGSGEGEANYLNDVHILDLKTMTWTSPDVKGDFPVPRDSHTAVAIGNQVLVYGGDCGNRYHGEVDVLDTDTLTWSRLVVHGSSPGARAGHTAVNIGAKVYITGGVGDKRYYGDVWVLDVSARSWTQLDTRGKRPHGRFSHTAVVTNSDVVIYGGCGDDERPLAELLILQFGSDHPNGRCNISMHKHLGSHWNQEQRRLLRGTDNSLKCAILGNAEQNKRHYEADAEPARLLIRVLDGVNPKQRRTDDSRTRGTESEQEEHALSLSQQSSPSQSDREQTHQETTVFSPFKFHHQNSHDHTDNTAKNYLEQRNSLHKSPHNLRPAHCESLVHLKTEHFLRVIQPGREEVHFLNANQKPQLGPTAPPLIGSEVHGTIDGAFDSGFLMTANVNGLILRGVLFAPGPGLVAPRTALQHSPTPTLGNPIIISAPSCNPTHVVPIHALSLQQPAAFILPESGRPLLQAQSMATTVTKPAKLISGDLEGVVLTLGGPGGDNCGT